MNWGENAIDGERGSVHKKRMREGRWRRERGAVGETLHRTPDLPSTSPQADDLCRIIASLIRFIHLLDPNVGFWLLRENGIVGSLEPPSGRNMKGTASDTQLHAPLWIPPVWCPAVVSHRCQPQYRHGAPGCGPLLRHVALLLAFSTIHA